ncbi:MAG: diguanylate cyclase [Anaerolineae bacterium]|nr:diguanylate cyclase [Anaerolineae bacterium]
MSNPNPPRGKDPLTGLHTRKAFLRILRERLPELRDAQQEVSFVFWDIDHFLSVNQAYGHEGGDIVLVEIARRAEQALGEQAILGRFGGDEFAAALPRVGREDALLMMDQLRRSIAEHLHTDLAEKLGKAVETPLTISIGIAACPVDGRTEYELMRKASEALYRAKVEGRNQMRLARAEAMSTKTTHYTNSQLERLGKLAEDLGISEAELLREAMDDLLLKYEFNDFLDLTPWRV